MKKIRIHFSESGVYLPDGTCLGVQGEHNAVQLVITLPDSMIEGMTYHTVTVGALESAPIVAAHDNADGAYRVGNVLYMPLTGAYTAVRCADVYVTAYRQTGSVPSVVDKTPSAHGLFFLAGKTDPQPGGTAAQLYDHELRITRLEDASGFTVVNDLCDLPEEADDGAVVFVLGVREYSDQGVYAAYRGAWVQIDPHMQLMQLLSQNSDVLSMLGMDDDGYLTFGGERIRGGTAEEEDTVIPLELGTAYDLLLRENWQDVPVYVTDHIGYSIGLYSGADFDADDCVRLYEAIDYDTGLPVPLLRVRRSGSTYTCIPRTLHALSQTLSPGWYDEEDNAVSAPSLSGMTFTVLQVALDSYTSLADLPAKAQSALETLSRVVNVSTEAMGGMGERDGAVRRFAGMLEAGMHYAFGTSEDFSLTFPTAPWSAAPTTIRMDLYCAQDVTMTLPRDKLLDGGTLPDTTAGCHTLEFTFVPQAGKWSVGHTDRDVPQLWDDIPDTVIPLEDCTWAQIKSIGEHGYRNRLGQWCIRRNNEEEVWFEIGDTKTVTLTNNATWTFQLWDFLHDNLADGSGQAPFTFGMSGLTSATYKMNNTNTLDGGWEACYFRVHTLPTILATLPEALRTVLSSVTKSTCIAQPNSNDSSRVIADTNDYLFLPTLKELGGASADGGSKYAIFDAASPGAGANYYMRSINFVSLQALPKWSICLSNGAVTQRDAYSANPSTAYKVRLAFCV